MTFPGSNKDIAAHASWIRWRINWYGVLWVGLTQSAFYAAIVAALTVIAHAI